MNRFLHSTVLFLATVCLVFALVSCTPEGGAPSAPTGEQPSPGSVETTGAAAQDATLPSMNLDGLVVSMEATAKPLISGFKPSELQPKSGGELLSIRLTALNSTAATITGVRTYGNTPVVRTATGRRAPYFGWGLDSDGAMRASGRHPVAKDWPKGPEGFSPGGRLTATLMCEVDPDGEYVVTWEFSPSRVAEFKLP